MKQLMSHKYIITKEINIYPNPYWTGREYCSQLIGAKIYKSKLAANKELTIAQLYSDSHVYVLEVDNAGQ
jgi:hypothetical protein